MAANLTNAAFDQISVQMSGGVAVLVTILYTTTDSAGITYRQSLAFVPDPGEQGHMTGFVNDIKAALATHTQLIVGSA